jgi:hypothetical protein
MFLEVIKQIQCVIYIKLRSLENESLVDDTKVFATVNDEEDKTVSRVTLIN